MERRPFLAGSAGVLAAMTAGCLGLLDDDSLRFEAGQATVRDSVATDAGYDLVESTDLVVEREFEFGGESQTVTVVNWLAEYEKAVDATVNGDQRAALFGVLTTPKVDVLGRSFNPIANMSTEAIAARIQGRYESIDRLAAGPETTVTILDTPTTVTRFDATVELASGQAVDVFLHVSEPVAVDDDFVIAVGGYPQQLPGEGDRVRTMMSGIEHDAD